MLPCPCSSLPPWHPSFSRHPALPCCGCSKRPQRHPSACFHALQPPTLRGCLRPLAATQALINPTQPNPPPNSICSIRPAAPGRPLLLLFQTHRLLCRLPSTPPPLGSKLPPPPCLLAPNSTPSHAPALLPFRSCVPFTPPPLVAAAGACVLSTHLSLPLPFLGWHCAHSCLLPLPSPACLLVPCFLANMPRQSTHTDRICGVPFPAYLSRLALLDSQARRSSSQRRGRHRGGSTQVSL